MFPGPMHRTCWGPMALARLEWRRRRRTNSSRKGRTMTDRSDSESPADQAPVESKPDDHGAALNAASVSSGAEGQADESRSGADVGEAVDIAESGTKAQGDHSHPERAKTGEAPVEQVFNDPAMTEGQRQSEPQGDS